MLQTPLQSKKAVSGRLAIYGTGMTLKESGAETFLCSDPLEPGISVGWQNGSPYSTAL